MPLSPAELAADALAAREAGAFAVHAHPRDPHTGAQTLDQDACDAAVRAIRAAVPGLPVGLSSSAEIDPDAQRRARAVAGWREKPDFVSVNLSEPGFAAIIRAALDSGIALEAGLATPADAEQLARRELAPSVLRALIEVDGGAEDARAIARLVSEEVPQLWHGFGAKTWEVIAEGASAGFDVRVGLEDTLVLPDERRAAGNAELVAACVELIGS